MTRQVERVRLGSYPSGSQGRQKELTGYYNVPYERRTAWYLGGGHRTLGPVVDALGMIWTDLRDLANRVGTLKQRQARLEAD